MLTITEFVYSGIIALTDEKTDRTIVIDINANTIEAHKSHCDVFPVMKLTFNKSDVLKFNKTSISTCNIEFLVYVLANSETIFNNVYGYINNRTILTSNDIKTCNEVSKITKSEFYNSFDDNVSDFVELFEACSSDTKQMILADHVCYNHEAKMSGIISLSTYVGNNVYCQARCKNCDNAICKYCYAASLTNQRKYLKNKLMRIHAILTNVSLNSYDIPAFDADIYSFFRFESFGDINNVIQVNNYNLIAAANPDINFTLWTKNPGIIQRAIDNGMILADNLVIGLSSLYLNKPELEKAKKYSFIRFLFTVYDDEYIKAHNIVINCGAKHCSSCGICYKYLHEYKRGLMIINERKK